MNKFKRFLFYLFFENDVIIHNAIINGEIIKENQPFVSRTKVIKEDQREGIDITTEIKLNYLDLIDNQISAEEFMMRMNYYLYNGSIEFFEYEETEHEKYDSY